MTITKRQPCKVPVRSPETECARIADGGRCRTLPGTLRGVWTIVGLIRRRHHEGVNHDNEMAERYRAEVSNTPAPMLIVEAPTLRSVLIAALTAISGLVVGAVAIALMAD
jgi:hypothetical protein